MRSGLYSSPAIRDDTCRRVTRAFWGAESQDLLIFELEITPNASRHHTRTERFRLSAELLRNSSVPF